MRDKEEYLLFNGKGTPKGRFELDVQKMPFDFQLKDPKNIGWVALREHFSELVSMFLDDMEERYQNKDVAKQ